MKKKITNPKIRLERFSYRFAEQVMNSKLHLKQEIERILQDLQLNISEPSRPTLNKVLDQVFVKQGWERQSEVYKANNETSAKFDFYKDRVGIEVQLGHASTLGTDLLKFQVASYSNLDIIDMGVFIVTTKNFQKIAKAKYGKKWGASLTYEKVVNSLPHFRSAIQVPIYVIGIDL